MFLYFLLFTIWQFTVLHFLFILIFTFTMKYLGSCLDICSSERVCAGGGGVGHISSQQYQQQQRRPLPQRLPAGGGQWAARCALPYTCAQWYSPAGHRPWRRGKVRKKKIERVRVGHCYSYSPHILSHFLGHISMVMMALWHLCFIITISP